MKLIFRSYLASLKEREELDAILPDLLSELGYVVYSRPQRGTTQAGVDIAAVGNDEDGERKVFLFSVKQGDLTRTTWNGNSPQALRPSLGEILDDYIPHRIPKRYQGLKVVICLVFGGDMQEQVRNAVSGYMDQHTTDRISFDEWNGDKLAGLLLKGVLREEIMPKELRSHFQKAISLADQPDIAYQHFGSMVYELGKRVATDKERIRTARQLYIALWVFFVWARDVDNVEAPYRSSELVLLGLWNLLRGYIGKPRNAVNKAISTVINHAVQLHLSIAQDYLFRKVLPHVEARYGLSMAVQSRTWVDVNLKLFEILGRLSLTGLWIVWLSERMPTSERGDLDAKLRELSKMGFQLINSNPTLFLPLKDDQSIEVSLFLMLVSATGGNMLDAETWIEEMAKRYVLTLRGHGRYPCVFQDYRDLIAHPREQTEEYRREATSGSTLLPLIAACLARFGQFAGLQVLVDLKSHQLEHCTLQLWMPDETSEVAFHDGSHDHGIAVTGLPLTADGIELLEVIDAACERSKDFDELSMVKTGNWPLLLMACRHHRFPVPPQFWRHLLRPLPSVEVAENSVSAGT